MFSIFTTALSMIGAVLLSHIFEGERPRVIDWKIDNLVRIGGHPITVLGHPQIITTDAGFLKMEK